MDTLYITEKQNHVLASQDARMHFVVGKTFIFSDIFHITLSSYW